MTPRRRHIAAAWIALAAAAAAPAWLPWLIGSAGAAFGPAPHHGQFLQECGPHKVLFGRKTGGLLMRNPLNTAFVLVREPPVFACILGDWTPTVNPVPVILETRFGDLSPLYVEGAITGPIEVSVDAPPVRVPALLVAAGGPIAAWSAGSIPAGYQIAEREPGRLYLEPEP